MQNIFISTIRLGVVAVLALTVFAGEAFAAPVLTPVTVSSIAETTVTLTAKVSNPGWKTTAVWFELGETTNTMVAVGMRDVFNEGFFVAYPYNLKPDTTYYVRAVAMEGGMTIYSPVTSFKTTGGARVGSTAGAVQTVGVTFDTQKSGNTNTGENTSSVSAQKSVVKEAKEKEQSSNKSATNNASNTAAVAGASGVFPQTLIGWITLFIAILVLILIARMTFESIEDRKKAREEAKKNELERESEHK